MKEQGCAFGHVLAGGKGAGKGPVGLWPVTGPNGIRSGDGGHQQGKLHSVRRHLASSICVTAN